MFALISVAVVLAGAASSYFWFENFLVSQIHETRMDIRVVSENVVGVTTDTDALHFGKTPPGGGASRIIILENKDQKPYFIQIKIFGNITQFITVSDNNFSIEPRTAKNVTVTATVPENANPGYYDGVLQAIFMNT